MDPDKTLADLRQLLSRDSSGKATKDLTQEEASIIHDRLCKAEELFQALDGWIQRGGYLPGAWQEDN